MADTTADSRRWLDRGGERSPSTRLELVVVWSLGEPSRVGEAASIGDGPGVVGRGLATDDERERRITFGRVRPGDEPVARPLAAPALSRRQLLVVRDGAVLRLERIGKLTMSIDGVPAERGEARAGSTIMLGDQVLLYVREKATLLTSGPAPTFPFGKRDERGILGESPAAWGLRDRIGFTAKQRGHVAVFGPSGSGKELVARGIHALSGRGRGPWIARNAATLPEGIADAELFGNAKNFPNPGMRERAGLVGEADGGTLFLDEVGELPEALQSHLLRLLDAGEYHRLGEDRARTADVRFIGATNRTPDALKHDLLARLTVRVDVPGLDERREDIPLLCRDIFDRLAAHDGSLARFQDPDGTLRLDPLLVEGLLHHDFQGHVRELEALLVGAMSDSRRPFVELTPGVAERLTSQKAARAPVDREAVEAALQAASGSVVAAAARLGMSRHALRRLLQRYGIAGKGLLSPAEQVRVGQPRGRSDICRWHGACGRR